MSDPPGQALPPQARPASAARTTSASRPASSARHIGWRIAGAAHWLAHHLGVVVLALAMMLAAGFGTLAWRLSQGPLASPLLAHWLSRTISADHRPTQVRIGTASLAWSGFATGVGSPLVIRVTDVSAVDPAGRTVMRVPAAEGALSLPQLLLGRLRPTRIDIDSPELRVRDDAHGHVTLDLGGPPATPSAETATPPAANPGNSLLAEMAQPARSDTAADRPDAAPLARLSHLHLLRITDAHVTVADQRLGLTWQAPQATIDLRRESGGGVVGHADMLLALGHQQARLTARADLAPGGETRFNARLDDVTPAALAADAPGLDSLQALDAPVTLAASGTLGPDFDLRGGTLEASIGAGLLRLAGAPIRLAGVHLLVSGTPTHPVLQTLHAAVAASAAATPTVIELSGEATQDAGSWQAALALTLDQVALADLPVLWPNTPGSPGARKWLLENVTAGIARQGSFHIGLRAPADLSDVALTAASGSLGAEDVTVHWLRPVPPVEHAAATVRVLDPDTLEIEVSGGRQHPSLAGRAPAPIELRHGNMRISGIMHPHQAGVIEVDLAGGLAETVALLREKRLHLLEKNPVPVKDPQGQVSLKLTVHLPLEDKVDIDDIGIRVAAHLDAVHLAGIAAGRDLDQGVLELTADNNGMQVQGRADVAGFATQLGFDMDFRAGPPDQVVQRITASGRAQAAQLARIGLDAGTLLAGSVGLQVAYGQKRNGEADLSLAADLTQAALTALMLDWRKPAGSPAHASLHALLEHNRLAGVDHLSVEAEGLAAEGRAEYADGRPSVLRLDHMVLGRSDASGSVRFPTRAGAPIAVEMAGRQIDLSARFSQHETAAPPPSGATAKVAAGTPYVVDARFERALMSRGQTMSGLRLHAENDGRLFQRARLEGQADPAAPFRLEITPERGGRHLSATAADAGQLLRSLDVMDGMLGGSLTINARYADAQPGRPLAGNLAVRDFRLRNAPFMAKLLQGITLYGLVNLINGPGLAFSRLEAPFRLGNDVLTLGESRMFNSALGLTAHGSIDLSADTADMTGTIVPAYFFNSLLGRVPLVGRLFSPEAGSGVFAADYSVHGRLADPQVSINPLSALTPGFLRNVFGIF